MDAFNTYLQKIAVLGKFVTLREPGMANSVTGTHPDVLHTFGIGPCLAVALYDTVKKSGTLAHVSVTCASSDMERVMPENELMHTGERVVATMALKLQEEGSKICNLEAKIAGECSSYEGLHSARVKRALDILKIPLVGERLGGEPKQVIMYLDDGRMDVFEYGKEPYFI